MTMTDNQEDDQIRIKSKGGGSIIQFPPIFSHDGEYIFIIWKNVVQLYSVKTGEKVTDLVGCYNNIIGATIPSQSPSLLIACTSSGELVTWKWLEHKILYSKEIKSKTGIDKVYFFNLLENNTFNDSDAILLYSAANELHLQAFAVINADSKYSLSMRKEKNKIISIKIGGSVSNNSQFIATLYNDQINVTKAKQRKKSIKIKSKNLTCMTCHPEEECIATGDSSGCIYLWRKFFDQNSPAQAIYHWHTLPVNVLEFSHSGTYLYSGGNECVLVKWRINNLEKSFLPRLPAPITHICSSRGNSFLSISTKNNAVHVVDAHFKIKHVIQHLTWTVSLDTGLKVDNRTKSLVLNGNVGNIQFYSPHTMTLLYNLDVVGQNKLTDERNINIPNTNVHKVAISRKGDWLACVEERSENNVYSEIRLKFFQFDEVNQTFILNTSVEYPHENGVNALEFQTNNKNADELLCATTGNDMFFKIWALVDTSTIYRKSRAWRCMNCCYYKQHPANALSFSQDGSALAVTFGPCLTVWLPHTCELKCSLKHYYFQETLRFVKFGNVDECHLVVTVSDERINVWNLLTLVLVWTVPLEVAHICTDPLSTYMAVFTTEHELFVFSPGNSDPIFQKSDMNGDSDGILGATFVPRLTDHTGGLKWQRFSQLYFINSHQELLCLETDTETSENASLLEYTSEPNRSAFSAFVAETTTSTMENDTNVPLHQDAGATAMTEIKQLLQPPVHTMAPMRLLCNSLLKSFVSRDSASARKTEESEDEDDVGKDENDDTTKDSDSESDTAVDAKTKQRNTKQSKVKELKKPPQLKKDNLKSVLSEPLQWTSVLTE